jgi:hypothetical protein
LPALLSLLDLPVADTDWPTLSPPQRRRRTLDAVKALLACECRSRPVVLLFEDLHWIDAETQAVLDTLVDSLGALRILLLVTHRPEYRHGWSGKSYFSQLRLLPLAAEAADRLMESLLGSDKSLDALKRELVARTEGTPFRRDGARPGRGGVVVRAPGRLPAGALHRDVRYPVHHSGRHRRAHRPAAVGERRTPDCFSHPRTSSPLHTSRSS